MSDNFDETIGGGEWADLTLRAASEGWYLKLSLGTAAITTLVDMDELADLIKRARASEKDAAAL